MKYASHKRQILYDSIYKKYLNSEFIDIERKMAVTRGQEMEEKWSNYSLGIDHVLVSQNEKFWRFVS